MKNLVVGIFVAGSSAFAGFTFGRFGLRLRNRLDDGKACKIHLIAQPLLIDELQHPTIGELLQSLAHCILKSGSGGRRTDAVLRLFGKQRNRIDGLIVRVGNIGADSAIGGYVLR